MNLATELRRLPEINVPDCAGFSFPCKARPPAPSELCDGGRNAAGGRKDQQAGTFIDRNRLNTLVKLIVAFCLAGSLPAHAISSVPGEARSDEAVSAYDKCRMPGFQATLVAARTGAESSAEVTYLSGGVGVDELDHMRAVARNFNLRLMFAERGSGAYLSDIQVSIAGPLDAATPNSNAAAAVDSERLVVDTTTDGPWFFAKLPAGRYRVIAESGSKRLTQSITIPASGHRALMLYF